MIISREEQLKILGQMQDSDLDYIDAPATDNDFWQEATLNIPPVKVETAKDLIGCLDGLPPDLSTNKAYMEGFGK